MLNWGLLKAWQNWATVMLMVLIGAIALHYIGQLRAPATGDK
jgi:hypothetical protein